VQPKPDSCRSGRPDGPAPSERPVRLALPLLLSTALVACGQDSFTAVLTDLDGASAEECPNGGVALLKGPDANQNGTLDPDEVETRQPLCDNIATLSAVVPAEAAECDYGGVAVVTGPDQNGNDVLDEAEVTDREVVCNGAQTTSEIVEATAEECPDGGVAIVIGEDADDDGTLTGSEVISRRAVCDGTSTAGSLVQTEVATAQECPDGGIAILIGEDTDGNGTLAGAEVLSRDVVCQGTGGGGAGDSDSDTDVPLVTVSGYFAWPDLPSLQGVQVIDGDLEIDCVGSSVVSDLSDLASLQEVRGDLRIQFCPELTSLDGLDALVTVGGTLSVFENEALADIGALSSVTLVGGGLGVANHPLLSSRIGTCTRSRRTTSWSGPLSTPLAC